MDNIILKFIIVIVVILVFLIPARIIESIKKKAEEIVVDDKLEYKLKVSVFQYIIEGLFCFYTSILLIGLGKMSMNFSNPRNYSGIAFILLGIAIAAVFLFRIFYLLPRTYIQFKDNTLIYFNGYKTVIETTLDNIRAKRKYDYESTGFYMEVIASDNKKARFNLFFFKDAYLLYAILRNKIAH